LKFDQNIKTAFTYVVIIWIVHLVNIFLPFDLRQFGLIPRQLSGLWGILSAPFLHAGIGHLIANSGGLFFLTLFALSLNRKRTFMAMGMIVVIGGGLTWLLGRGNVIHIGASGLIFGLIGFLLFFGIFRREWKAVLISFIILVFYGGTLLSLLYYIPGISWESHFFGFVSGVFSAWELKYMRTGQD